ncbi:MAG: FMN-binding protein [Trebonia sp.]|jgi:uncharacterized protein with FMN-binding domain
MRRTIITIGSTAAGLAALLAFKSHPVTDASAAGLPATTPSPTLAVGPGNAGGASGAAGSTPSASGSAPGATSSASRAASKPMSAAMRTVTGTVANTQYGPMQVQLVLTGKQITKVNVLQRTDNGQESNQIDSFAIPKLTSETLTAQSARIDAVSGATYTSQGYIQSLQSALDQA